ncbi:Retrovirus-related Pol polyprotein from transposon [Sesamum angolense]|uniref:Retrovirus-related Pol polyprotein from transposon n=1 Tax=Sesamum angolense TaxID=2727404 RepID=A0AAE1WJB1_9LAMI|nr:Retrovirus-related Pol polyprotein from transposon [Sesamum angolense]
MLPKSTQALEEAITALSERLADMHASMEQCHDSLVAAKFERLCNRVLGLPPEAILNCFIPELRLDIQWKLAVLRHSSISQAISLAKLLESKFHDSRAASLSQQRATTTFCQQLCFRHLPLLILFPLDDYPLPKCQSDEHRASILIAMKILAPITNAKPSNFFFFFSRNLIPRDLNSLPPPTPSPQLLSSEPFVEQVHFQLSSAVVSGLTFARTLCLHGLISGHPISILVDSGSSYNIIQPRIEAFLALSIEPVASFSVLVGNGESLHCSSLCSVVPLTIHSQLFTVPSYILPIFGVDVVLGAQWLCTLDPFLSDFSTPSMQFYHNGTLVTLSEPHLTVTHFLFPPCHSTGPVCYPYPLPICVFRSPWPSTPSHSSSPYSSPPSPPTHQYTAVPLSPLSQSHHGPNDQWHVGRGHLRSSSSPFSSPILLVKKKDDSWRFCVDYRALNAITVRDHFPIPTVNELLDELHGATVVSKLDLRAGYHQIRVVFDDVHKTAFRIVDDHFEFLGMPFGHSNAPSTFQLVINSLFRPLLRRFVLVFFDDILIYSPDWTSHLAHITEVLQLLNDNCFYVTISKCPFGMPSVDYLGHIISTEGVAADPSKLEIVANWPGPHSLSALRGFLGLIGIIVTLCVTMPLLRPPHGSPQVCLFHLELVGFSGFCCFEINNDLITCARPFKFFLAI